MNDVIVIVYIMLFVYMVCAGTTEEDWSCFVFSVQALIRIGDTFDKLRLYKHLHDMRVRWDDACKYEWFERWDGVFPADKLTESWNVKSFSVMLIHAVLCSVPIYPNNWYEFLIRVNVELTINFLLGKLSLSPSPSICMLYAMLF